MSDGLLPVYLMRVVYRLSVIHRHGRGRDLGTSSCSAEPPSAGKITRVVATDKNGVDEAEHAEISYWMRPHRATRAISAGRLQLESYQKL